MTAATLTIRIDDDLRKKMNQLNIDWSEYIRDAIRQKIASEARKEAGAHLISDLKAGRHRVPKGFINKTIRETRGSL